MNRAIIGYLIRTYAHRTGKQDIVNGEGSLLGRLKPRSSDMIFLSLAVGLLLIFIIAGVVELISATPLSKWVADAWHAIVGTSPQSVQNLISQQPDVPQLPNTTIGDILGAVGRAVMAPLDFVLAALILVFGIFVRLRSYLGRVVSEQRAKSFRIVSWIVLTVSLVPPVIDFATQELTSQIMLS